MKDIFVSLGVRYPDLYNLDRLKPSQLIMKGSRRGMDIYSIAEMDDEKFVKVYISSCDALNIQTKNRVINDNIHDMLRILKV